MSGMVIKINLSTFTRVGAITLNSGETGLFSAVIDTINGFAYFGTVANPGIVVKINLSTFTEVSPSLTFNSGEGLQLTAVINTTTGFAYFTTL
jgi:hypothetical protein